MKRGTIVAKGVYCIGTQPFGICNAGVPLGASLRYTKLRYFLDKPDTASFFARYSCHRRPSKDDTSAWCGAILKVNRRAQAAYKGTVLVSDTSSIGRGMCGRDDEACRLVLIALPSICSILLHALMNAKYDRDI